MIHSTRITLGIAVSIITVFAPAASAQVTEDWAVFTDNVSQIQCDVVNGANNDFVVLFESGALATLSGVKLPDIVVDLNDPLLPVTFEGQPVGFIDFREDANEQPTLFWLSLAETIVGIDSFTSEPFDSGRDPGGERGTHCDACAENVIDSPICEDGGGNDDDGFPPIDLGELCGSGSNQAAVASLVLLPVMARPRRRRSSWHH